MKKMGVMSRLWSVCACAASRCARRQWARRVFPLLRLLPLFRHTLLSSILSSILSSSMRLSSMLLSSMLLRLILLNANQSVSDSTGLFLPSMELVLTLKELFPSRTESLINAHKTITRTNTSLKQIHHIEYIYKLRCFCFLHGHLSLNTRAHPHIIKLPQPRVIRLRLLLHLTSTSHLLPSHPTAMRNSTSYSSHSALRFYPSFSHVSPTQATPLPCPACPPGPELSPVAGSSPPCPGPPSPSSDDSTPSPPCSAAQDPSSTPS